MIKISVIMASYNYARYIKEAIESVLTQTFQDWELIIVDDGSSDNSVELINTYCKKDDRIKFFQHKNAKNMGLKETLLLGISKAKGDWIAFLESDDSFEPTNLEEKNEISIQNKDVKLIFSKVQFKIEDESLWTKQECFENKQKFLLKRKSPCNLFYDLAFYNYVLTFSNVLVKKESLCDLSFNSPDDYLLDWWLWIQLAARSKYYFIDKELVNWRLHKESYVQRSKKSPLNQIFIRVPYLKAFFQKLDFRALFVFVFSIINVVIKKIRI
jgi:glycosyltransferase involved in cell wall biosynthesis